MNRQRIFTYTYLTLSALFTTPRADAAEQIIEARVSAHSAEKLSVEVFHRGTASALNGLGLRLHWDSRRLTWQGLRNTLPAAFLGASAAPRKDSLDYDGDPATDSYIQLAWFDLAGHWPGQSQVLLFNADFGVSGVLVGPTAIRFSASSTTPGHSLNAAPLPGFLALKAEELPALGGAGTISGVPSSALFYGGALLNGTAQPPAAVFAPGTLLDIAAVVQVEARDQGTPGELLVAAALNGTWFSMNEQGGFQLWNGTLENLQTARKIKALGEREKLVITSRFPAIPGSYMLFAGYRDADGDIHYSATPIHFSVREIIF